MSDGLTVSFALASELSGALDDMRIIVTGGLAEVAAGSIAMGLGGYLAGRSDAERYDAERRREEMEVRETAKVEAEEVADVFRAYGLTPAELKPMVDALRKRPQAWVDFMMRFELGLEKPDSGRALASAVTIALAYDADRRTGLPPRRGAAPSRQEVYGPDPRDHVGLRA
jgi:vacuolar iron transporter family protein